MKIKFFITLALVVVAVSAISQVSNLRAIQFASNYKYNGKWLGWTKWTECDILIVYDLDKEYFKIYSSTEQLYNIISIARKKQLDGSTDYIFLCSDSNGQKCQLKHTINSDGTFGKLYIEYSDLMLAYSIKSVIQ